MEAWWKAAINYIRAMTRLASWIESLDDEHAAAAARARVCERCAESVSFVSTAAGGSRFKNSRTTARLGRSGAALRRVLARLPYLNTRHNSMSSMIYKS
jgi:hypothetical protein